MSQRRNRKTDRTVINSQAREIITKVYDFMKKEAIANHVQKLTDARWRTAQAVGVSERTVTRILKEKNADPNSSGTFTSPMKKRKVEPRIKFDDFDIIVVRRTIENFQIEFNKFPSLLKLKNILREKIGFQGCLNTLRKLLLKLGYKINAKKQKITEKSLPTEKHEIDRDPSPKI